MQTNEDIMFRNGIPKPYHKMIEHIWEDSTFCDYWNRIPRGVDFESLEPYFVDFIIEHYENNELFIQLMDEMNPDGLNSYENHESFIRQTDNFNDNEMNPDDLKQCLINDKYECIFSLSLNMLWGFNMIRDYPPHFWNLAPRQKYCKWFLASNDEKMKAFYDNVEKKVWENYYSRNHYVLK
jgi:hypothetical protein